MIRLIKLKTFHVINLKGEHFSQCKIPYTKYKIISQQGLRNSCEIKVLGRQKFTFFCTFHIKKITPLLSISDKANIE